MGTRAITQLAVDPASLLRRVPPHFRAYIEARMLGSEPVDLMIFETGAGHVVTTKDFERASQKRVRSGSRLVVVGYDFTQEVRAQIDALGGILFSQLGNHPWTDKTWHDIKQR